MAVCPTYIVKSVWVRLAAMVNTIWIEAMIALALLFCRDRRMKRFIFHYLFVKSNRNSAEIWEKPTEHTTETEEQFQLCQVAPLL